MSITEPEVVATNGSSPVKSILGNLKERRQQIVKDDLLTLPVPRWVDPAIFVRYVPIEHAAIRKAQDAVEAAPKKEKYAVEVRGNIDLLIKGCVAVFARLPGDDRAYSLREGDWEGEPTTFDVDLARNLGLDHDGVTARETVKALFITEGDIISHAQELIDFSGYRESEADDGVSGE
jgi:hypothetical protein